jgi:hypothetical protein
MARISFGAGLHDTDTLRPGTYGYSYDHDRIEKIQAGAAWLTATRTTAKKEIMIPRSIKPFRHSSLPKLQKSRQNQRYCRVALMVSTDVPEPI